MSENFLLYVLMVLVLGIRFLSGRWEPRRYLPLSSRMIAGDHFRGLNHLLNERHVPVIDTVVEAIVANNEAVGTYLALGSLACRRGEVDKPIRIRHWLML